MELTKRRGTVDECVAVIQTSLLDCVDHGVDPFLVAEIDRLKDNGLMRAMIIQALCTQCPQDDIPLPDIRVSCGLGALARMLFKRRQSKK